MFVLSCAFIGVFLFILGSSGNGLCIIVFLRQKFRHRIITPYFIILLFSDSIYLLFRLIKLFYYSQTLFNPTINSQESCSNTLIARAYQHATQTWPQTLVPLVHSETYMRFSLILMCIISIQRTTFITRSLKRLVLPSTYTDTHKHKWTFLFIILSFILAYIFEFVGLTLFCSKSNNRDISYQWFIYMSKYMSNSTYLLTNTITDQPDALKCVNSFIINLKTDNETLNNSSTEICSKEQLMNILSYYFDQHQRSIVSLIQKIFYHQTGHRITRNEIRRKFHFHECLFPQEPNFFHKHYNFMYSRRFGFNRYTLVLVFGSVLPSLITIISNIFSVYRVRQLNHLTSNYILPCRRRTDDTRRVIIVITIECLFAILNSWFSDILISVVYCKGTLLADDDCPMYLKENYDLLVMFDMFNSISNIILHCLCGKHFRNELKRMFYSLYQIIKRLLNDICCCYLKFECQKYDPDALICYHASVTGNDSSNSSSHLYLKIRTSSRFVQNQCCDCRWYFNKRQLNTTRECLSTTKQYFKKNRTLSVHYKALTQRTQAILPSESNSMRLYFPQQSTTKITNKKCVSICS